MRWLHTEIIFALYYNLVDLLLLDRRCLGQSCGGCSILLFTFWTDCEEAKFCSMRYYLAVGSCCHWCQWFDWLMSSDWLISKDWLIDDGCNVICIVLYGNSYMKMDQWVVIDMMKMDQWVVSDTWWRWIDVVSFVYDALLEKCIDVWLLYYHDW